MQTRAHDDPDVRNSWWIKARGQIYGPYAPAQLAALVAEGRVTARTLVSIDQNGGWRSAAAAGLVKAEPKQANALASARDDRRLANMAIWADLPSGGEDHVETILKAFGESGRIARDLWVLRTLHPAAAVRAAIAAGLSTGERFLIIDANRGRLAWSNLGLDAETKLRRIWDGGHKPAP